MTALRLRYLRRSEAIGRNLAGYVFQIPPSPEQKRGVSTHSGLRHYPRVYESLLSLGPRQQRHLSRWQPLLKHDLTTESTLREFVGESLSRWGRSARPALREPGIEAPPTWLLISKQRRTSSTQQARTRAREGSAPLLLWRRKRMDEGAVVSRVVSSSNAGVIGIIDAEVTGHRIDVLCP